MNFNKILMFIGSLITNIYFSNAVQVIQQEMPEEVKDLSGLRSALIWIFGLGFIILGFVFFVFVIALIIMKINKKIQEFNRKRKDYLYYNYEENVTFCHNSRDYEMKKKNWKTVFIMWKRNPVYVNTEKEGMKQIGFYNGESNKKEGFFLISVFNKLGFFKTIETIILIPLEIKDNIMKKIYVNGEKILILDCEGVDEVGSTDYYFIPLIKDTKTDKFIDFSDKVRIEFTDKIVLRNEIKELLQESRDAVIKGVEMNPNIQFKRRDNN